MRGNRLGLMLGAVWWLGTSACGSQGGSGGAGSGGVPGAGSGGAGGGDAVDAAGTGGQNGTGGAPGDGSGGAVATGGAGGASDAGAPGTDAPVGRNPNPTCSDAVLRTGPPAGKEFLKADPVDTKFPFSTHWMGRFSDDPTAVGITGMADYDNDGDLDFSSGQRGGPQFWWEYCTPDHWVQHRVGTGHNSPGGGNAVDVDGDGWVDIIAGDSWYRNPQNPRQSPWQRYFTGVTGGAEDVAVGDVSGDGKPDVLWVWSNYRPQWRMPGADPTQPWPLVASLTNTQTQGGSIGDIDGDGHNDIVVGNQWWYRNVDGKGTQWETIRTVTGFDDSPLTNIGDVDGDGDMDIVMCTHFGARAAWAENGGDGKGQSWTLHVLASNKNKLHSIFAMDFDNDGDLDIYSGESSGRAWIWENVGNKTFVEHSVATNARGHDARVGDVDCDGDLDIPGKPWGEGEGEPRDHIYLQNMTVERGGKAVFNRPAGEVWAKTQTRKFCP